MRLVLFTGGWSFWALSDISPQFSSPIHLRNEGAPLTYHRLNCSKSTGKYLRCYQVEGDACMRCPKRPSCFDKAGIRRRVLASSCYPAFFRGHQRVGTPEYLSMMRLRKIWAEGSFSVLKREHCISKIRKRGILAATEECLLAAMALNLKRMAKCHLSLSPNLLFCWGHDGFQQVFCFCQQVHHCILSFAVDCVDIIVDITKIPNIRANASPCIANICNRHSQGEVFKSW